MHRNWNNIAFVVTLVGIAALLASQAESQVGPPKAVVALQPSTPGTSQSGHLNVSGTVRAGSLIVNSFQLSTGAATGRVLTSNATGVGSWTILPGATGAANGDLTGTYPNPTVDGLLGRPLSTSAPMSGQQLTWTGTDWAPATDPSSLWTPNGSHIHYMSGNVGVGTVSPFAPLHGIGAGVSAVVGQTSSTTIATRAVAGYTSSSNGIGVYGEASVPTGTVYGVQGSSSSTSGIGVGGLAASTTGFAYGLYGRSESTSGIGVYGFTAATSGQTYSVYGATLNPVGTCIKGEQFATTGNSNAVLGVTSADGGKGVAGFALSTTGSATGGSFSTAAISGIGVVGTASHVSGNTYGVYGSAIAPTGWAVWANGRSGASGTKSFRIDHPFDPANKYLLHYSSESPEPQNFYNGIVTTDAQGVAWVELPNYFQEINRDFRYTLTIVDDSDSDVFVQAKVAKEIRGNKFKIRTSGPNVKVSWEVKAIRNDKWIQRNGAPIEMAKTGSERGKYLHPELYEQPANLGFFNQAEIEKSATPPQRIAP